MSENQNKVKKLFKKIGGEIYKNSSIILMGSTIASGLTAIGLGMRATTKAKTLLDSLPVDELYDKDTGKANKKYVVKNCWKLYIPTMVSTALFIASAILTHTTNERKAKALAKAFTATSSMLALYEEQIEDSLGEEKAEEIKEALGKRIIEKKEEKEESKYETIEDFPPGTVLCYDPLIGREFPCDRETIRSAVNDTNQAIIKYDWACLNDFYSFLGLDEVKLGYDLGWDFEHQLSISYGSCVNAKGIPCLVLLFNTMPRRTYED